MWARRCRLRAQGGIGPVKTGAMTVIQRFRFLARYEFEAQHGGECEAREYPSAGVMVEYRCTSVILARLPVTHLVFTTRPTRRYWFHTDGGATRWDWYEHFRSLSRARERRRSCPSP
jgi:hypothetical protein